VASVPPRSVAEAVGSLKNVATAVAATVAATVAPAVPPEPVPTAVDQATVVEIPDDDALPPGWGQWEDWPAPAPEPVVGVLVVREDGRVVPRQPTHGAEASSSRWSYVADLQGTCFRCRTRDFLLPLSRPCVLLILPSPASHSLSTGA
jgi:hypothetical protein